MRTFIPETREGLSYLEMRQELLYELIGSHKEESRFLFTTSGAEAVNQLFWSVFLEVARKMGKTYFILSSLEDAPTMQMAKRLEELSCTVKIVPATPQGQIDLAVLEEMCSPRTALISLSLAQGLTGVIQPIQEVSRVAKKHKTLLHVEASYAVGTYPIAFSDLGADYLTFSGEAIHSVASGALFAKRHAPLIPLILGAVPDIPSFLALSAAAQQALLALEAASLETARLFALLEKELKMRIPAVRSAFEEALRLPNARTLFFPRVHQEALLYWLDRHGVKASIGGDHCQHLYRLLMASQYSEEEALTAISFSLSRMTSEEEIMRACGLITEAVQQLQTISEDLF